MPEGFGRKDSVHRSLWRRIFSDAVFVQQVLTVRHHCHREFHLTRVQLGPGVEFPILPEWNVTNCFIWFHLLIGYYGIG